MGPPRFASPPSQSRLSIAPNSRSGNDSVYAGNAPLYQVDYTCVNAGRTVGATKRRIRWRFGFADLESLSKGKHGMECRGEEHEIVLNWSLASGKQVVQADGHDVHVSCKPYELVFECSWNMRGNHVVRIKGHAKPAALRNANERQFDMWIDGRSFFDFDQIYTLGHSRRVDRGYQPYQPSVRETIQEQPRPKPKPTIITEQPPSEKVEWPTKKNFTFNETTPRTVSTFNSSANSFDFASQPNTPSGNSGFNAAPAPTLDSMPSMYEPQYDSQTWLPAGNQQPQYAPAPSVNPEYELQHRMSQVEYQVQEAYKQAPAVNQPQVSQKNQVPAEISAPVIAKENDGSEDQVKNEEADTYFEGDEFYTTPMLEHPDTASVVAPSPVDPMDELVNKLCNLNDITSAPEEEVKLTINPFKKAEEKEKKKITKSTPNAPTTTTWYGPQPTLAEMKAVQIPKTPTQEVMKPNLFQQQAGAAGQMVVYGEAQNPNEAPPLDRRPQGFGVGAYTNPGYGVHTAPQQQYAAPNQYANYSY